MENTDYKKICRICLNKSPNKELSIKHKKLNLDYYFLLNSCAPIQAEINDSLPDKICKKCEKVLINYYKFRQTIIENDTKLKENLHSKKNYDSNELEEKFEIETSDRNNSEDEEDNVETLNNRPEDGSYPIEVVKVECLVDEAQHTVKKKGPKPVENTFICDVCGKFFNYKGNMLEHMKIHTGEKPFQCPVCGKRFRRIGQLKVHKRIHTGEKTYECKFCQRKFIQDTNLKIHLRTHSGERPYMCTVCGRSFAQSSNLLVHNRTHTGELPYKCEICGKGFTNSSYLKSHVRFFHNKERNVECEICKKKFSRNRNLRDHLLTHTGERPHSCKLCSKTYRNSSHLHRHMKSHVNV